MIRQVYGESDVQCATVFRFHNEFSEVQESIHAEQRSKWLMTTRTCENTARVADILKKDRRSLCRLIAEWTRIPKTIVQQILREYLQKRKLRVRFLPVALTAKQKEQHPQSHLWPYWNDQKRPNFLDSIITGDESWCFSYDLETKCQKFRMVQSEHVTFQKNLISKINAEGDADFVFWQQRCNSPRICIVIRFFRNDRSILIKFKSKL